MNTVIKKCVFTCEQGPQHGTKIAVWHGGGSDLFYFKCSLINVSWHVGKNVPMGPPGSHGLAQLLLPHAPLLASYGPGAFLPSELLSPTDLGMTVTSSERSPRSPCLCAPLQPLITAITAIPWHRSPHSWKPQSGVGNDNADYRLHDIKWGFYASDPPAPEYPEGNWKYFSN